MKRLRAFFTGSATHPTALTEVWAACAQARALRGTVRLRMQAQERTADENDRLERLRRRGWATVTSLAQATRAAA
ncbi:MAG TPA: hypothetical protein VK178_05685 [Opitutaceae bacterium]|nr:hypothetical protein [Opitutaceae bacterium]